MQKDSYNFSPLERKVPFQEILSHVVGVLKNGSGLTVLVLLLIITLIVVSLNERAYFIGIVIFSAFGFVLYGRAARKHILIGDFARQNNLTYFSGKPDIERVGVIFNEGHSRSIADGLRSNNGDFAEIANYTYTTGSGKSSQTHTFGYMCVRLPRRLPHLLLDAKSNNLFGKISNLPSIFGPGQTLALEGDFNNYFTLYAPREYQRDALYVLTPDIMQLFIEESGSYDIEIIDDLMYIYSSEYFALDRRESLEKILAVAAKLKAKIRNQTDYYADERVGNRSINMVSTQGQRLKKFNTKKIVVLIVLAFILLQALIHIILVMNSLNT